MYVHCIIGNATRECYNNGTWGDANVLSCQTLAIFIVAEEVCLSADITLPTYLSLLLLLSFKAKDVLPDATEQVKNVAQGLIEKGEMVTQDLIKAIDNTAGTGLLPRDLETTNNVVKQVG